MVLQYNNTEANILHKIEDTDNCYDISWNPVIHG